MLIAFQIVLMVMGLFMSIGVFAEEDKKLKEQLQYLVVFDILVLLITFLFID